MSKNFEQLSLEDKLHISVHRDVRNIATEVCHMLGLEIQKEAMDLISELVYKKILSYGTDLEAFAKHAKRNTLNSDDVKLLVRRNSSLKAKISALSENLPNSAKDSKKKRAAPVLAKASVGNSNSSPSTSKQINAEGADFIDKMEKDIENMDVTVDLTFDDT